MLLNTIQKTFSKVLKLGNVFHIFLKMRQTSESQFTLQVVPAVYSDTAALVPSAAKHFSVVEPEVQVAKVNPRVPHLHCPSLVSQVFTSLFSV